MNRNRFPRLLSFTTGCTSVFPAHDLFYRNHVAGTSHFHFQSLSHVFFSSWGHHSRIYFLRSPLILTGGGRFPRKLSKQVPRTTRSKNRTVYYSDENDIGFLFVFLYSSRPGNGSPRNTLCGRFIADFGRVPTVVD